MSTAKNAILKAKIEDQVSEIMLKTDAANVYGFIKSLRAGTTAKTQSYVYPSATGGSASQYYGDALVALYHTGILLWITFI